MPREVEKILRTTLRESNFRFMPDGIFTQKEIYDFVENNYPSLCDNNYLCIQNCKSGHNSPEWKHVVRSVMQSLKNSGRLTRVASSKWELK